MNTGRIWLLHYKVSHIQVLLGNPTKGFLLIAVPQPAEALHTGAMHRPTFQWECQKNHVVSKFSSLRAPGSPPMGNTDKLPAG